MRPGRRAVFAIAVAALVTSACQPDTVRVAFRPRVGATYRYVVTIDATTTALIGDAEPKQNRSRFTLRADHRVLRVDDGTSVVRVVLRAPSVDAVALQVRLDRQAQLVQVEQVEGVPADALGQLGLSEIFPAAAGAPPDRALAPGSAWLIDDPVQLTGVQSTRIRGNGRLAMLGVVAGREVATVETSYRLPVRRRSPDDPTVVLFEGEQRTSARTTHDLKDGAVETATSRSEGTFRVHLPPPAGEQAPAVTGQLLVDVRSTTRRLR